MTGKLARLLILVAGLTLLLAACAPAATATPSAAPQAAEATPLPVLATTALVGDVVHQVGGELIALTVLLPPNSDPHSYEPAPQDVAAISDAAVVFANGAGLEEWLQPVIESANVADKLVEVSDGIELLNFSTDAEASEEEEHSEEEEAEHHDFDPHTWTDPNNVILWVQNIAAALSAADPANAAAYEANAQAYTAQLEELDAWIRSEVEKIPVEQRTIVTDHRAFGYFVDEYGFNQVGAIIPAYSTMASPSAQEIANLEDAIAAYNVQAVFVGNNVNDSLAQRVAEDTDVQLIYIYTGSLSDVDGPAATYIDFMHYDVNAFISGLQ